MLVGLVAAPAVLRLGLWMPVRAQPIIVGFDIAAGEDQTVIWLQDQMTHALTELLQSGAPIPYTDAGLIRVENAIRQVIATFDAGDWQAHVDRSLRSMLLK